jgi:hypothetical protein
MSPTHPQANGGHQKMEPGLLRYRASPQPGQNPPATAEYAARMAYAFTSMWDEEEEDRRFFPAIGSKVLLYFHRELLSAIEPDTVIGRYRTLGEDSVFEVWEEQPDSTLRGCLLKGLEGDATTIERAVKEACDEFEAAVAAYNVETQLIRSAVIPPAKLYHALLRIRPFPIANDPIALLVFHAAYHRFGLDRFGIVPREPDPLGIEFNHAIARSLQPKSPSTAQLIDFLAAHSSFFC